MKTLATAACLLILSLTGAAADQAALARAERLAIEAALTGTLDTDAPAEKVRERLAGNERALGLAVKRDADLRVEIDARQVKINSLKKNLAANPGAMRGPRDQVQLMRLSQQTQVTLTMRQTLAPTVERLTRAVAEDRARLLLAEGGTEALNKRLKELPPG